MLDVCGNRALGALAALTLLLVGCGRQGVDASELPIPDGSTVSTLGYEAVVLVQLPNQSGICSGTFIDPRTVLTAAHCVTKSGNYRIVSSFGTFNTSTKVALGPGVVNDPRDIALLILSSDVADRARGQVYRIGKAASIGQKLRLIGYGCNNIQTRTGSGVKRTATNVVYDLTDYLEFASPLGGTTGGEGEQSGRFVGGYGNLAYSCFGDSGGPAVEEANEALETDEGQGTERAVVAVTHAGGRSGDYQISEYANLGRPDNRAWLAQMASQYSLDIRGL